MRESLHAKLPFCHSLLAFGSHVAHTHTHTPTLTRAHARTHARTHARARTHTHAHTHARIHTHTPTLTRAHAHTHVRAHARSGAHELGRGRRRSKFLYIYIGNVCNRNNLYLLYISVHRYIFIYCITCILYKVCIYNYILYNVYSIYVLHIYIYIYCIYM